MASLALGIALVAAGCGNQGLGPGYANGDSGGLTYAHEALTKHELMPAALAAAKKAGAAHFTLSVTRKTKDGTTCSCMSATGDVVYGTGKTTMSMKMVQQGRRLAIRLVGGTIYLQMPGVTPRGRFVLVDPRDKQSEFARGFADGGGTMDPTETLKSMQSAIKSAERVGKQTMDGVTVEHYQVEIATAPMLRAAGYEANAGGMPDTVVSDLWLDQSHRIHQVSYKAGGFTFEQTLSRWGKPVHIKRPAPSQLVTMPGI